MTEEAKKTYPPAASAAGNNAYYLKGCDVVGRSPAYASCLFKIAEHKAGRDHEIYRDCYAAIESRQCRAAGMKEEEDLKGAAIYFFPRTPPQAVTLPQSVAGDFGVKITNLTDPALIPKDPKPARSRFTGAKTSPKPTTLDDMVADATRHGFADAITSAVTDAAAAARREPNDAANAAFATVHANREKFAVPAIAAALNAPPKPAVAARPAMLPGETPLQYARRLAASR